MKTKSGTILSGKAHSISPLLSGTPVPTKLSTLTQPTASSNARYHQTMAQRTETNKKTSTNTNLKKKKTKRLKSGSSPILKSTPNNTISTNTSSRTNTVTIPRPSSALNHPRTSTHASDPGVATSLRVSSANQYQEQLNKYETLFNKYQLLYDQQKGKNHSIEKKIVAVEDKIKEMDLQLTTQAKKYGSLRHRVDNIEGNVSSQKKSIEELFTLHETKLKIFEERLTELRDIQERYRRKTAYLQKKFKDIDEKRQLSKEDEPDSRDRSRDRFVVSSMSSLDTDEEQPRLVVLPKKTIINSPIFKKDTTSTEFLSTESENEMLEEKPKIQRVTSRTLETFKRKEKRQEVEEKSDSESDYPPQKSQPAIKKEVPPERISVSSSRSREQELKQRFQDLRKAYGRVYGKVD